MRTSGANRSAVRLQLFRTQKPNVFWYVTHNCFQMLAQWEFPTIKGIPGVVHNRSSMDVEFKIGRKPPTDSSYI